MLALNGDELALLVQEERTDNVWTAAARQAALEKHLERTHGVAARAARLRPEQRQQIGQRLRKLKRQGASAETLEKEHGRLWASHARDNVTERGSGVSPLTARSIIKTITAYSRPNQHWIKHA